MEKQIAQLVDMGATRAQAKAALAQHKDVMEAAEKIFEGKYDDIVDDDGDVPMPDPATKPLKNAKEEDSDEDMDEEFDQGDEEDEDGDDYVDYDSDDYTAAPGQSGNAAHADPYAGIFFSKDRREEVIEVEESPEYELLPDFGQVKLMNQGEWMKGCPEGSEQQFLFSLYTELSDGSCNCPQECGQTFERKKRDFFALHADFTTYISQLTKIVRKICPGCDTTFCFACGEAITEKVKRPNAAQDDNPLFHCSNLQGVILGIGLSMTEHMFTEQVQDSESKDERTAKRRKTNSAVPIDMNDTEDEYSEQAPARRGTGYSGAAREDQTGELAALAAQKEKDQAIGKLLAATRVYLPNLSREGGGQTSDYLVHPTALAHLRRRFNYVCSALLRNDSLADMSGRSVLYFELLEWLETISNHEALASMMAMPIMTVVSVKGIISRKTNTGTSREKTIVFEGSSSPRELLEGLSKQAKAALKGLESYRVVEQLTAEDEEALKRKTADDTKGKTKESTSKLSEENQKLLDFCNRILTTIKAIDRSLRDTKGDVFVDRLHATLNDANSTDTNVEHADEEQTRKIYEKWAKATRFEYCDLTIPFDDVNPDDKDQSPHFKFYYNNEARMLANADIPKRSLAIAKELSILVGNLPVSWGSSVFLRADETRVDVIKALIIGPEGTPYHNGCFLFDVFLGAGYNSSPPSVKYMTTNGGKYRFNPNLYADGKVCLSLLGTWSGPGWVAGKSTLLQVLVSIQSMILCDEPYLNEPGWANSGGTPQSKAYSANVRRMVVNTAMLGNLKNPPEPFADVIRTHFRLKAKSVTAQLDDWLAKDDGKNTLGEHGGTLHETGGSRSLTFKSDVAEMKKLLETLSEGGSV